MWELQWNSKMPCPVLTKWAQLREISMLKQDFLLLVFTLCGAIPCSPSIVHNTNFPLFILRMPSVTQH